ncbi:hypothetical protein HK096_004698, partial [Nowakowskiella sp. JEL0078]
MSISSFLMLSLLFSLGSVAAVTTYCPLTSVVNEVRLCISAAIETNGKWVVFTVQSALPGWVAFGVGSGMSSGDIQVAWRNSTGSITLSQRTTSGYMVPTVNQYQQAFFAPKLVADVAWAISGVQYSFRRPVASVFSGNKAIGISKMGGTSVTTQYMWAVSRVKPANLDDPSAIFNSHAQGDSGTFIMDFFPPTRQNVSLGKLADPGTSGAYYLLASSSTTSVYQAVTASAAQPVTTDNAQTDPGLDSQNTYVTPDSLQPFLTNIPYQAAMLIHGLFMFFAWNISGIAGVFVARYFKNTRVWFRIHSTLVAITGAFSISGIIFVILYVVPPRFALTGDLVRDSHFIMGVVMLVIMISQFVLGFLSVKKDVSQARFSKNFHGWFGRALLMIMIPECYLGIQLYSPNAFEWHMGYLAGLNKKPMNIHMMEQNISSPESLDSYAKDPHALPLEKLAKRSTSLRKDMKS